MISTRNLSALPDPVNLELISKSLAMLDAIVSPEWEYRYFSFNSRWSPNEDERMASMRNGSGDHYYLRFSPTVSILKGFDHESVMSPWSRKPSSTWPGVLSDVPSKFASFLAEPAFEMDSTTFCIWRAAGAEAWSVGRIQFPDGDDPDGSAQLLWALDGKPATYVQFARDYFEVEMPADAVERIYRNEPLTQDLAASISAQMDWVQVLADANEIAYPVAAA